VGSTDQTEFPTDPNPDSPTGLNTDAASELIKLARRAFEEKRLRDCLVLTGVILRVDPGNSHAQVLQSWIHSDLQQEFERLLKLADEARANDDDREIWGKVEMALRSLLDVVPDHQEAGVLLEEARATRSLDPYPPATVQPENAGKRSRRMWLLGIWMLLTIAAAGYSGFIILQNLLVENPPASTINEAQGTLTVQVEEGLHVFVDGQDHGPAPIKPIMLPVGKHRLSYKSAGRVVDEEEVEILSEGVSANRGGREIGRVDLVVVPTAGVDLTVGNDRIGPVPQFIYLKPGVHQLSLTAEGYGTEVRQVVVNARQRTLIPVLLKESEKTNAAARPSPAPVARSAAPAERQDAPPRTAGSQAGPPRGRLAITSPSQVEVYSGGRFVGSTPLTLELPVGEHTLEYRYEAGQRHMTHLVRQNETTPVSVPTDIVVAINAQPWAEVFVRDSDIIPLGQTPLTVRIPVGSLIIFRHPKFSDKTYRVTSKDTTISASFP
jgi:hypothetical protein